MDGLPWATVQRMLVDAPSYQSPSSTKETKKNTITFDEDGLGDIAAQINKMPR
jgi:hypothetical protein